MLLWGNLGLKEIDIRDALMIENCSVILGQFSA